MGGWSGRAHRGLRLAAPFAGAGVATGLAVLVVGLALSGPGTAATGWRCRDGAITAQAAGAIATDARLCDNGDGSRASMTVRRLTPGVAYSAWLAYFDRPSSCKVRPCGPSDTAGRDPPGVIARLDGGVAGADGALQLAGELHGVRLSPGSQVSVMVYGHGPAIDRDNHYRARQLLARGLHSVAYPSAGPPGDWSAGEPITVAVFIVD